MSKITYFESKISEESWRIGFRLIKKEQEEKNREEKVSIFCKK